MDEFFDEDTIEVESMRKERKKLNTKDFARLINKKDINHFELDELFM